MEAISSTPRQSKMMQLCLTFFSFICPPTYFPPKYGRGTREIDRRERETDAPHRFNESSSRRAVKGTKVGKNEESWWLRLWRWWSEMGGAVVPTTSQCLLLVVQRDGFVIPTLTSTHHYLRWERNQLLIITPSTAATKWCNQHNHNNVSRPSLRNEGQEFIPC